MNKTEFARSFAEAYDAKIGESYATCSAMFNHLAKCIRENDRVYIKGLGTFKKKKHKGFTTKDISTGNTIEIPDRDKIVFEIYHGDLDEDETEDVDDETPLRKRKNKDKDPLEDKFVQRRSVW